MTYVLLQENLQNSITGISDLVKKIMRAFSEIQS